MLQSFLTVALAAWVLATTCCGIACAERAVSLVGDVRFDRGLAVLSSVARPPVQVGILRRGEDAVEPIWRLAQWHSRFSLGDAQPTLGDGREVRYFDGAKAMTLFAPGSEADASFSLDGIVEYDGKLPREGDAWPHLLVECNLSAPSSLVELSEVRFAIQCRLVRAELQRLDGFDLAKHTAQFQFFIVVQNQRGKTGRGDYYWFGIPIYDARHRIPPAYVAADIGSDRKPATDKLIYTAAGETFTTQSAHDGKWVTIEKDVLPLIRQGLEAAWDRGFLKDSHDPADYGLGYVNLGWEVTGPLDVEMQVRGLKLDAVYAQ